MLVVKTVTALLWLVTSVVVVTRDHTPLDGKIKKVKGDEMTEIGGVLQVLPVPEQQRKRSRKIAK